MRRCFGLLAFGLAALPLPAVAQLEPKPDCDNAANQTEMNECAAIAYVEADKALNAAYAETARRAAAQDKDLGASNPDWSGAAGALKAAQRAWIQFRDAQCELAGFEARGGSMEPMLVRNCLADLTRRRTQELNQTLKPE